MKTARQNLLQSFAASQSKGGGGSDYASVNELINILQAVLQSGDPDKAWTFVDTYPAIETYLRAINPHGVAAFLVKSHLVSGSASEIETQIVEEAMNWRDEALNKIGSDIREVAQRSASAAELRRRGVGYQTMYLRLSDHTFYFRPDIQVLSVWSNSNGETAWRGHYREIDESVARMFRTSAAYLHRFAGHGELRG